MQIVKCCATHMHIMPEFDDPETWLLISAGMQVFTSTQVMVVNAVVSDTQRLLNSGKTSH